MPQKHFRSNHRACGWTKYPSSLSPGQLLFRAKFVSALKFKLIQTSVQFKSKLNPVTCITWSLEVQKNRSTRTGGSQGQYLQETNATLGIFISWSMAHTSSSSSKSQPKLCWTQQRRWLVLVPDLQCDSQAHLKPIRSPGHWHHKTHQGAWPNLSPKLNWHGD